MLQAILFRIVPTALEISMVCGILVSGTLYIYLLILRLIPRRINLAGTLPQ